MTEQAMEVVEGELIDETTESTLKAKLAEIDKSTAEYKRHIEMGTALKELRETSQYKLLFTDGYMKTEPERILQALLNPTLFKRETVENLESMLSGVRTLNTYLGFIEADGAVAQGGIEQNEDLRKQVTADPAAYGLS